ncbi:MAG TPA: DEDD exonuclease domain-containing protein [Candidatus Nanopelagicaceae bacterium]|nr:DEDD exonuclease domain-containing protein [Candidatus Nanopelagicaceae bacterium]
MNPQPSNQLSLEDLGTPLLHTTFVVVDLETTGGSPKAGAGITEIGAVKVRGGEVLGEFRTFVNPGYPIPAFITTLTGITDHMVREAPHINSALSFFMEFCGDPKSTVLVAHNAPFDLGFLKAAASDMDLIWPGFAHLDTAKLARQILSREEAPNCKLSTLSALFRTEVSPNHRALDDARATVEVLHALIARLGNLKITTLEDLRDFSSRTTPAQKTKRHLADGIPSGPGVYIFRDRSGSALYVGTSNHLRSRVRSYFTASEQRRRILDMLNLVETITAIPCATSVEAQVRELRLINEHQPTYNRRSRHQDRVVWLAFTDESYPRLSVTRSAATLKDERGWMGPFTSRVEADSTALALHEALPIRQCTQKINQRSQQTASACALFEMGRCGAPCTGEESVDSYQLTVKLARDLMNTDPSPVVSQLEAKMIALGGAERFEEAAEIRDRIAAVQKGVSRGSRIRSLTKVDHLVAGQPTVDGGWDFICVRYGRLAGSATSKPGFQTESTVEALVMSAEVVLGNENILPHSTYEECERILDWLENPGTRLFEITGQWSSAVNINQEWRRL